MLDPQDIKNLTEYQIEVFKDVFMTKEDGKRIETQINLIQNSLDVVYKGKITKDQEVASLNHRMKHTEDWIDKAAPKLKIDYKH